MTRFFRFAVLAVALVGFAQHSHAASIVYVADLNGPNEVLPPGTVPSPGIGTARVTIDTSAHTMHVEVTFSGLTGNTTASHIHSATAAPFTGTAGVATTTPTFANFPLGVTSGSYDQLLDLTQASSYNPSFVTANGNTTAGAEAALEAGIASGMAYLNIHTSTFGGGEIRGFLVQAVPEPGSLGLLAVGALGVLFASRRARR